MFYISSGSPNHFVRCGRFCLVAVGDVLDEHSIGTLTNQISLFLLKVSNLKFLFPPQQINYNN